MKFINLLLIAFFLTSCGTDQRPSKDTPNLPRPHQDQPKHYPEDDLPPTASAGKLIFSPIPQLPENWWNDEAAMFNGWDKNTLYLWGANPNNYQINDPKQSLNGNGMAGPNGPTRGRGHPNYIGLITTSENYAEQNNRVFDRLVQELRKGKNVVVPTAQGKFALGTGIAFNRHFNGNDRPWKKSQHQILRRLDGLAKQASAVDLGANTFWPDCGMVSQCAIDAFSPGAFFIRNRSDITKIKNYATTLSKNELQSMGWQLPNPAPIAQKPEAFFGVPVKPAHQDTSFTAFTIVLFLRDDGTYEVLTQKRAIPPVNTIETMGGHLTGGQSYLEGAVTELMQESGIELPEEALIYLQGGNPQNLNPGMQPRGNANFFTVLTHEKPATTETSHEIDKQYGHQWKNIKELFREADAPSERDPKTGYFINGKFYKFFNGHLHAFCSRVVGGLGICQ